MSDVAAVAASTGVPEDLVMRAAKARAAVVGSSAEDLLAAWAGGGSAPAAAASAAAPAPADAEPPAEPTDEASPETEAVAQDSTDQVSAPAPSVPNGEPMVVVDQRADAAPVLVGRTDRVGLYVAAIVLLFVVGAIFAVALPARDAQAVASEQLPGTTPELSAAAETGRQVYMREGCFYCHTQQVRTVVTDVGLGPVTEPGTSAALAGDTFGFQRLGPDLTHVGSREPTNDPTFLRAYLRDPQGAVAGTDQPAYAYLSDADLDALVQYLIESK